MKEVKYYGFLDNNLYQHKNILIDANIILNHLYSDNSIGDICENALQLLSKTSHLFLSNVVISEIINKVIYRLFQGDMYYQIDNASSINYPKEIDKIVTYLNTDKYINFSLIDEKSLNKTNFNKCFNLLNKDKNNRYLLKSYFDKTMEIYNNLKDVLNFKYLSINEETYDKSLDNFQCQLLGINDAQHLQVAIDNEMDYILTCDRDFSFVKQSYKTQILKIDNSCIKDYENYIAEQEVASGLEENTDNDNNKENGMDKGDSKE
jgi:predicted nucleic acid-binding protein